MTSSAPLVMIFLSLIVNVVFVVEAGVARQSSPPGNKIVGGEPVDIAAVPWQVALLDAYNEFVCGGIIISEQWILTAAHCLDLIEPSTLVARVGSNAYNSGGQTYKVSKGMPHEEHDSYEHNDICVLMTATPMNLGDSVVPKAISLPRQGAPPPTRETMLFTSGWGRTSNTNTNSNYSPILMGVQIEMVEFSECQRLFQILKPDESQQLCAGKNGLDSCGGDSGGPLVRERELVGIVSYGPPVCGKHAAIYTKVSNYRDWIRQKTGV